MYYIPADTVAPRAYVCTPPQGESVINFESDPRSVDISDVRGYSDEFTLDKHGVAFRTHESAADLSNNEDITKTYYKEVDELLRAETGGTRTFVFDHTVRRGLASDNGSGLGSNGGRAPVYRVHNDYTHGGAEQRVRDLMGDEADSLLQRRFQVYSVWRPLWGPVVDAPLAVMDVRTAAKEDFVTMALVYSDRVGQNYLLKYNPAHRWYYLSGTLQATT
jgi:hypothetical protein